MVNQLGSPLDAVFSALADPTRRAMLEHLRREPAIPSALAGPLGISRPAVSRHLRVLERADLIRRERRGREHVLRIHAAALDHASNWIADTRAFWERQLDSLGRFLDAQDSPLPKEASWPAQVPSRRSRSRSGGRSASRRKRSTRPGRRPRR
jgi:DNA-binding transcriptional ArsR family regulator